MKQTIKIDKIEKAKPEKGVWFDYYGDIFVSVIPIENKKHIRRKAKIPDSKKDNKMSHWHLKWQYEIIENSFGMPVSGKKTYEIPITINGEKHIIDSLVSDKIAIEFQHTLSVSLDEMNSRAIAHKQAGLIPYLVLDFSVFRYEQYQEAEEKLNQKLKKWFKSKYYEYDNLFIDFQDKIIRISKNVINSHLTYNHKEFVSRLKDLETYLIGAKETLKKKKLKEAEERRVQEVRAEERRKEKEAYYLELERDENRDEKFNSEDYKYFRKCFKNKTIRPFVIEYAKDIFNYKSWTEEEEDGKINKKYHWYWSKENPFEIYYVNVSFVEKEQITNYRGRIWEKKKFTFWHSEISIIDEKGKGHTTFEIEKGMTRKI